MPCHIYCRTHAANSHNLVHPQSALLLFLYPVEIASMYFFSTRCCSRWSSHEKAPLPNMRAWTDTNVKLKQGAILPQDGKILATGLESTGPI